MVDNESLQNLEKLHQLKNDGIISDEEFEKSKERLLFGSRPATAKASEVPTDHMAWMLLPLKRYAQFEGRSSRKEFWMFLLGVNLVNLVWIVLAAAGTDEYGDTTALGNMAFGFIALTLLAVLVPMIAVQVRRFHDQDRSGWFALLNLIPYAGVLIVLGFMLVEGTRGSNRYGPDPRGE